jgi:hypothetical protein
VELETGWACVGAHAQECVQVRVLGVGLSRTGTTSLTKALEILGYRSLHYDQDRLRNIIFGHLASPDFRVYDDYDAVTDLPTAFFYRELLEAYPDCKAILTVRDIDAWWHSMKCHYDRYGHSWEKRVDKHFNFVRDVRNIAYGSYIPREYLYKKRFTEHNEQVLKEVNSDRLLVMDITAGDGWDRLCSFLGEPAPDTAFPFLNVIGQKNETSKPKPWLWLQQKGRLRKRRRL